MGNCNDHITEKIDWRVAVYRALLCAVGGGMVGFAVMWLWLGGMR